MTHVYRLLMRDSNRTLVRIIDAFDSFVTILRFNAPATWTIEGVQTDQSEADHPWNLDGGAAGMAGIVLERDGVAIMSGRAEATTFTDSADGALVNANGLGDLAWLGDVIAHPSPADLNWNTQSHDVRIGRAESLIHDYVDANIGPSALAERRLPGLEMGTDSGRGTVFDADHPKRARAEVLLSFIQQIAAVDGIGFGIRQSGTELIFETFISNDLRATAVFGSDIGNLGSLAIAHQVATTNYIYVGGSGEGTARIIAERGDSESIGRYGRREVFVDQRQSSSATELGQTIADRLESGKGGVNVDLAVLDTDAMDFGTDYELGDLVSVQSQNGLVFGYVTEVRVEIDADGVHVTPTVSPAAVAPMPTGQASITAAIRQLSANAEGPTIGEQKAWVRPLAEKPSGWQLADGTNGTTDRRGVFDKGASNDGELGTTAGASSANLAHTHTGAPHGHPHDHTGAPHTHVHVHAGAVHTHTHVHTGAVHFHSHQHFGGLHTHDVDLNHNHASFTTAGVTPSSDLFTDTVSNPTDALRTLVGDHVHAADPPPLGTTTVHSDGGGSATALTTVDATGASAANTGSDSTGASAGNTGSDGTAASFSGHTGSDSSAASFSGPTGSALGSVTIDPPHVKVYWLERVA